MRIPFLFSLLFVIGGEINGIHVSIPNYTGLKTDNGNVELTGKDGRSSGISFLMDILPERRLIKLGKKNSAVSTIRGGVRASIPSHIPRRVLPVIPSNIDVELGKIHSSAVAASSHRVDRHLAFGDYTDPTFSCPATTTCPIVCVANVADCPLDAQCPGTHPNGSAYPAEHEYELCLDGNCADLTAGEQCEEELESPCECEALPIACAKQVDLFSTCTDRFGDRYEANVKCLEEQEDQLPQVRFTGPWFLACYIGISAVTLLMLLWCAWNQRWGGVQGSSTRLECAAATTTNNIEASATTFKKLKSSSVEAEKTERKSSGTASETESKDNHDAVVAVSIKTSSATQTHLPWTQTGYKSTIVGTFLYALIVLTHLIIQFLLLFLTIEYYVQQEATGLGLSNLGPPMWHNFEDDKQVLKAFEIAWMVGFVWCFFLKYPASIRSLFLRRCVPEEATYVAVSAPVQTVDTHYETKWIVKLLEWMGVVFRRVLRFLYSDESQNPGAGTSYKVTLCKVWVDGECLGFFWEWWLIVIF